MKVVNFNKDFPKLDEDVFCTIRKPNYRVKMGNTVKIESPSKNFKAICTNCIKVRVGELPDSILLHDTGTSTREEALELLREFYPGLEEIHKMTLLWFVKPGHPILEVGDRVVES